MDVINSRGSMPPPRPTSSPQNKISHAPQGGPKVNPDAIVGQGLAAEAEATVQALLATGSTPWEAALTLVNAGLSLPASLGFDGVPSEALRHHPTVSDAMEAFGQIAMAGNPIGANAAFNAYLAGRKAGDAEFPAICYRGQALGPWITSLPDGLEVMGDLALYGSRIAHLPQGLRVGGNLDLTGCGAWNRTIPADTMVGGRVFTGRIGLRLEAWRKRFPEGEAIGKGTQAWKDKYKVPAVVAAAGVGSVEGVDQTVLETFTEGLAAGLTLPLALQATAADHGNAAVLPLLIGGLRDPRGRWLQWSSVLPILSAVASQDPRLANLGVDAWGAEREIPGPMDARGQTWLQSLPKGMRVKGNVDLAGTQVTTLPQGFRVEGDLNLANTPLVSLPKGTGGGALELRIKGTMDLTNCQAWDGHIPYDTQAVTVITDTHPDGLTLEIWRSLHPQGERSAMVVDNQVNATIEQALAKGGNLTAVLKTALRIHGSDLLRPILLGAVVALRKADQAIGLLCQVATVDPTLAQDCLSAWGRDRWVSNLSLRGQAWVKSLPEGLRVGGESDLSGTSITALPNGLQVDGNLDLRATPIVTLPLGLRVGGRLTLTRCDQWDGQIPLDARVKSYINTDLSGWGDRTLGRWRQKFPNGERS
jgi:hypothetical protein